ncbi:hypothetical protein ACFVVM_32730 [Nocardia sp. NPDC058176]|uniref:hypothetical protein n=1 Tax=Nocardia sp. NPDC058176 TaxID=3346368 RepID=UPI0036D8D7F1
MSTQSGIAQARVVASRAIFERFLPPTVYADVAGLESWVSAETGVFVPGFIQPDAPGGIAAVSAELPLHSWIARRELFPAYTDEELATFLQAWDLLEGHRRLVHIELTKAGGFLNTPQPGVYFASLYAEEGIGVDLAGQIGSLLEAVDFGVPPDDGRDAPASENFYAWWYGV